MKIPAPAITELVEPRPGERILDVGSVIGAQAHHSSTFGCDTVGVVLESLFVEKAQEFFPDIEFELRTPPISRSRMRPSTRSSPRT